MCTWKIGAGTTGLRPTLVEHNFLRERQSSTFDGVLAQAVKLRSNIVGVNVPLAGVIACIVPRVIV
jgi:hypothetical protein